MCADSEICKDNVIRHPPQLSASFFIITIMQRLTRYVSVIRLTNRRRGG